MLSKTAIVLAAVGLLVSRGMAPNPKRNRALTKYSNSKFELCGCIKPLSPNERSKANHYNMRMFYHCGMNLVRDLVGKLGAKYNVFELSSFTLNVYCFTTHVLFGYLGSGNCLLYSNVTCKDLVALSDLFVNSSKVVERPMMKTSRGMVEVPLDIIGEYLESTLTCYCETKHIPFIRDIRYILYAGVTMKSRL